MPFLPARHYVSDHQRFIDELRSRDPAFDEKQRQARAIWWDKDPRELELRRQMDVGRVAPRAYVYQTD